MAEADANFSQSDMAAAEQGGSGRRKIALMGVASAIVLASLGYGLWYAFVGSHYVGTDNAYVGAETAQVTPMVAGQVLAVLKSDTDTVKRGEILVKLDDRDVQIALATAEADLAKARRQFGQATATSNALSDQVAARGADIRSAKAQLVAAQAA